MVTDEESHSGETSGKSGIITHNQSSTMSITQTTKSTEISFFKKVSSETNYDFLHFYIDDEDMGQWSGNLPWSEERYYLTQGTHTFKWSYIKDYSVDLGHDCAWVDDINIEPIHTSISYSGGIMKACANESVHINHSYAYNYHILEWTSSGDGSFEDSHDLHPIYIPGPNDQANGGTTLQLRVDGIVSPLQLILTDDISLGDEIIGDDIIDPHETLFSHYSIESQEGIDYIWQLEPVEAGILFNHGNNVDIVWDFRHGITEAILSVTADANCSQASLSKTIQIDVLSLSEQNTSSFNLYPNPTDDRVHLILEQDLHGKSVVEIYNVLGTRTMDKSFRNLTKGQSIAIDLKHYTPGIYIIKLCNDEGCWSQKVSVR